MSITRSKGCFPFVSFAYSDAVVCLLEVDFTEDLGAVDSIHDLAYQGKGVAILFSDFVEAAVIDAKT
jgi:hypothetical protein